MKYKRLKGFVPLSALIGVILVTACTKEWDDHYDEGSFDLPDKTVTEYIKEQSDLSTFYGMLETAGYDDILNASQSYTVWAPKNEALSGLDLSDTELVTRTVRNHIARSRITTSGVDNSFIRMLNNKYVNFAQEGSGYTFGEHNISNANQPAKNGLVHVVDGYAPYVFNLWEYIGQTDGLDSLREYIYGQSKVVFDAENSTEIGTDEEGNVLYDSVFIVSNPVLERLGNIDIEDSTYTAIMPDNTAWDEAYSRIEGYYNFPEDAGGIERQREVTRYTVIQDMFFRGRISQPENYDSLRSTYGNVFHNPAELFKGLDYESLSNGLAYVTDQMPFEDTTSFFKEIRVEAEYGFGRTNTGSNIYTRSSYGTEFTTSNNYYILVEPTSTAPRVEFSIPNTLSAKYNIYCVFVPAKIVDPNNLTPTKAKFQLTYIRRASGSTFIKRITPENNITDTEGLTKMFVDQFDFEFANVIDADNDKISVKLEVINDVSTQEEQSGEFDRTMRIDCIILEPVME
ncbi:fasciclin domain-containing protein [Maribellus sediminis]|uniref:fasciclin domain-containing protein n=1 Tax=Maribellus sediminis TaxID=2696285 RepID=UPI00142FCC72|nr:fasciclin domain-containing protein [Maribellus sediminis]